MNKWPNRLPHKSVVLLVCLLLLLVLSPVLEGSRTGHLGLDLIFCLVMVLCILDIEIRPNARAAIIAVALLSLGFQWIGGFELERFPQVAGYGLSLALITAAFYNLMKSIILAEVVDHKVIVNAISAYLLLGIIWALIFTIIHLLNVSAFDFDPVDQLNGWTLLFSLKFVLHRGWRRSGWRNLCVGEGSWCV